MPTDGELKTVRGQLRMPTETELDAQRKGLPETLGPASTAPKIQSAPVDIEALAKRFRDTHGQSLNPGSLGPKPALLVFVSLSMPRESLSVLAEQAARAKATLVLRGLVGRSFQKTAQAIRSAGGEARAGWIVDPRLFDRFEVSVAPTVVLANAAAATLDCADSQCVGAAEYAKIAGDVSLDYSLRQISSRQPSLAPLAKGYLERLGPKPR
jgi:conjugal transfer pilus assembly protein TrbC